MSTLLFAFYCAIVAVAFASVKPGLFEWWFKILLRLETKGKAGKLIAYPFGLCEKCLAGQLGFWAHFYASGWSADLWHAHVLCSCSAILFAALINKAYEWSQKH